MIEREGSLFIASLRSCCICISIIAVHQQREACLLSPLQRRQSVSLLQQSERENERENKVICQVA